jgi:Amt family ammonium transporter
MDQSCETEDIPSLAEFFGVGMKELGSHRRWSFATATVILVLLWCGITFAQDAAGSAPVAPAPVPAAVVSAAPATPTSFYNGIDSGSTAWMLTSTALVLFMVPGLALFYGGMVRAKNVLNMFLMVMVCIGVIGLIWIIYGYAISFPTVGGPTTKTLISLGTNPASGNSIISLLSFDPSLLFLNSFNHDWGRTLMSGDITNPVSTGIPELAFVMFQGKFAIITPALIVGAVAERVRFGPLILFMVVWSTLVYFPVAHWVWNVNGWLYQMGVLDFAGGTVVHVLGGVSALAICLVVGPRTGYGRTPMPPHSLGLTLIGAGLLWFGWFGFNAGSAVGIGAAEQPVSGTVAALAFVNTQTAAAAAATAWMFIEWIHGGKPTILGFASGMVAGLVVITPCAGHVLPWSAIIIGVIGGGVCYMGCRVKNIFKYDDSLDAFGVHGIGGAVGAILVGFFVVRPISSPAGWPQVWKQIIAVVACALFCFIMSYIIALVIMKTIGLRVTADEEFEGLDITIHGESGYNLTEPLGGYVEGAEGHPDARGSSPEMAR